MSARARKPNVGIISEINMTPLIDVSLVLVVILLVATPLAFQSSLLLSTAAARPREAATAAAPDRVEVTVLSEESVRVGSTVVPRPELARALGPAIEHSASRLVVVRCADGVTHGTFVGVLDQAHALGAVRIAVVGR